MNLAQNSNTLLFLVPSTMLQEELRDLRAQQIPIHRQTISQINLNLLWCMVNTTYLYGSKFWN